MNPRKGERLSPPSSEMLAAYADGEFEGNHSLSGQKQSIEAWLEQNPDAAADIVAWRRLNQLWQLSSPDEPADASWDGIWARIDDKLSRPAGDESHRRGLTAWQRGNAAAALLILCGSLTWLAFHAQADRPEWLNALLPQVEIRTGPLDGVTNNPEDDLIAAAGTTIEPFEVATAEEITILHVEAADTPLLAVGRMPLDGPVELARPGEVVVYNFVPASEDNMLPDVLMNSGAPMIWARVDREMNDP